MILSPWRNLIREGHGISDGLYSLSAESLGKFSLKCLNVLFFFFFHRKSSLSMDIQFRLRTQYNVRRAHVPEKISSPCSFIYSLGGPRQGTQKLHIPNFLTSNRDGFVWLLEKLNIHTKGLIYILSTVYRLFLTTVNLSFFAILYIIIYGTSI